MGYNTMMKKIVYVFGNTELKCDALPVEIVPKLQEKCPKCDFQVKDPVEDWDVPEDLWVIDTVVGLKDIHVFEGIDEFTRFPKVTVHDYDALSNLLLLKKLGRLKKIVIIGIPPEIEKESAINEVARILS